MATTAEAVVVGGADVRPFRASRFAEGAPLVGAHDYGERDYGITGIGGVMVG